MEHALPLVAVRRQGRPHGGGVGGDARRRRASCCALMLLLLRLLPLQRRRWLCRSQTCPSSNKESSAKTSRLLLELVVCRGSLAALQDSLGRLSVFRGRVALARRLGLVWHGLLVPESPRDGGVGVDAKGVKVFLARERGGLPDDSACRAAHVWAPRRSRARQCRRRTIGERSGHRKLTKLFPRVVPPT